MKKAILLLLLSTTACFSQVKFGAKAGATLSKFKIPDNSLEINKYYEYKTGFYVGVFAKEEFGKGFSIEADILFSRTGTKFFFKDEYNNYDKVVTQYSISTPVTLQYNLSKIFFIETGGSFGFILERDYEGNDILQHPNINEKRKINKQIFYGIIFGFGFNIDENITLSGRYFMEMDNKNSEISRVFSFGVGYSF